MPITTSYFAVCQHINGTKIAITRYTPTWVLGKFNERNSSFAPSEELLGEYKKGELDWSEFRQRYTSEQRKHYKESPGDFEDLLDRAERENLVLLCYEKYEGPKTRCHRMLLFDLLKKISEHEGLNVDFINEQPYNKKNTI